MIARRKGLLALLLSGASIAIAAYVLVPSLQSTPTPSVPLPHLRPRLADAIVAQARDSSRSQAVFPIETPRVYAAVDLVDVPVGARIGVRWVSLGVGATAQESVFSSDELVIDSALDRASFILGRPEGGWRPGPYRVDLLLNDQVQAQLTFRVE